MSGSVVALQSSSLSTFISLNALQPDQLAQLLIQSITYTHEKNEEEDEFEGSISEAIGICERSLKILHSLESTTVNKQQKIRHTNQNEENGVVHINKHNAYLSRDCWFMVCEYLDPLNKARLRFTSMSMHIYMMGFPLDLADVTKDIKHELSALFGLYNPMRMFKPLVSNSCGCDVSRQFQLIDHSTAQVNQTLCSNLTHSQLYALGIGRPWLITGINIRFDHTIEGFMGICDVLKNHHAYRSIKRLKLRLSSANISILASLPTCDMAEHLEDIVIVAIGSSDYAAGISLSTLLTSCKVLRSFHNRMLSIGGGSSLNDFVQYSPQIEELSLVYTKISGDITCLSSLKNLTVLRLVQDPHGYCKGDVVSLSSLIKLKELMLYGSDITGNIASLSTLTNLNIVRVVDTSIEGNIESLLTHTANMNSLALDRNENLKGILALPESIDELHVDKSDIHLDLASLVTLNKLKCLNIESMPNVMGDISMLSSLTKLGMIHVTSCHQMTGSINTLATLPLLERINLVNLPSVNGEINSFATLPLLRFVTLKVLPGVTGDKESFMKEFDPEGIKMVSNWHFNYVTIQL